MEGLIRLCSWLLCPTYVGSFATSTFNALASCSSVDSVGSYFPVSLGARIVPLRMLRQEPLMASRPSGFTHRRPGHQTGSQG